MRIGLNQNKHLQSLQPRGDTGKNDPVLQGGDDLAPKTASDQAIDIS